MDMSMSMPSSTMAMPTPSASHSMSMSMPSSTAAPMDMDMSMGGCKISMTWNWNTIDACFISQTWRITTKSVFAGSCIGVVVLVVVLEGLRRAQREFDSYGRRKKNIMKLPRSDDTTHLVSPIDKDMAIHSSPVSSYPSSTVTPGKARRSSRLGRQLVRALLHTVTFGVAYFIMLMAMYYNGYIIICILIGAFLGAFLFSWDQLDAEDAASTDACETTLCCG